MSDEGNLNAIYSYHTFLFPFLLRWEGRDGDEQDSSEEFLKYIKEDSYWKETILGDSNADTTKYREEYATYRYFNNNARSLLTGENEKSASRFVFEKGNKNRYQIYYDDKKGYYDLEIRQLILSVYSSSAAVLRYDLAFCEGGKHIWDETKGEYQRDQEKVNPVDVNRINEKGRRIYIPFINSSGGIYKTESLNANKITLIIEGEEPKIDLKLECDFDKISKKLSDQIQFRAEYKNNYIPEFITGLINHKKNQSAKDNKKKVKPVTILDDRMFVGCLLKNDAFIRACGTYLKDKGCYGYLEGETSEELYRFCYIETFMTCQSKEMRTELLRKTVYDRWIDYKTLHGVTHHSFVCLTAADAPEDSVVQPFITSYMDMAVMVMIQRATLLTLSNYATDIANSIPSNGRLNQTLIDKIQKFHGEFIKYKNQIFLFEVTPQEQGVELFNKLRDEMYIEEELKRVDDNIRHLNQLAEGQFSSNLNWTMFHFAAIAIVVSLFTFSVSVIQTLHTMEGWEPESNSTRFMLYVLDQFEGVWGIVPIIGMVLTAVGLLYWIGKVIFSRLRRLRDSWIGKRCVRWIRRVWTR